MKNIVFFNHFHNGDIHVSREFVKKLTAYFYQRFSGVIISYSHRNDPGLLLDIPGLHHNLVPLNLSEHESVLIRGETIFINTWYAQKNFQYMNRYGISFDCLYSIFDDICRTHFNITLADIEPDPQKWFPSIDYSKYQIQNCQKWLDNNPGRKIFVTNSQTLSGQSKNFDMTAVTNAVAHQHPSIIFIISNHIGQVTAPNIIYSSSIISKSSGFDLNENAFLTEHCDVIIGRASGAFTFAMTQKNMFERSVKFICFSNLVPSKENDFWISEMFHNRVKYVANFVIQDIYENNSVCSIINMNI